MLLVCILGHQRPKILWGIFKVFKVDFAGEPTKSRKTQWNVSLNHKQIVCNISNSCHRVSKKNVHKHTLFINKYQDIQNTRGICRFRGHKSARDRLSRQSEQKSAKSFIGISRRWQMESGCERWILDDFYISNARMREYRRNVGGGENVFSPIHPHSEESILAQQCAPLGFLMRPS